MQEHAKFCHGDLVSSLAALIHPKAVLVILTTDE
jgi:hypothetical protein